MIIVLEKKSFVGCRKYIGIWTRDCSFVKQFKQLMTIHNDDDHNKLFNNDDV